jgi:hypothetical protein
LLGNFEEPASTDNLEDLLAEKDLRYLLNERILTLPEKCREIAAMLNIAPKTVENQLT